MNALTTTKPAETIEKAIEKATPWGRWKVCINAHYSAEPKDCSPETFNTIEDAKDYRKALQNIRNAEVDLVRFDV